MSDGNVDAAQPQAQARRGQPDPDVGDERRGRDLVHGAARARQRRSDGAHPLQEAGVPAVEGDGQAGLKAASRSGPAPVLMLVANSSSGIGGAERRVGVAKMAPEEIVEVGVVVGRMVVAVPPEPVAAFGDEQFLERPVAGLGRHRVRALVEHVAGSDN